MPEHNEPDSGSKTYQSIVVYDGSDPAYFKNWHAKVLSHYATWLNGEDRAGHWKQHLVSDGCFMLPLSCGCSHNPFFLKEYTQNTQSLTSSSHLPYRGAPCAVTSACSQAGRAAAMIAGDVRWQAKRVHEHGPWKTRMSTNDGLQNSLNFSQVLRLLKLSSTADISTDTSTCKVRHFAVVLRGAPVLVLCMLSCCASLTRVLATGNHPCTNL